MGPNLRAPYKSGPDCYTIPSHLPIDGIGLLPVNAFLLKSAEPILIDTGLAIDRSHFEAAVWSLIDPAELRWIILTHDDRDHAGNLREMLMAAPNATVITNALAVARLGEEWDLPRNRVRTVNPGRTLRLGGRELAILRPPSFDSPSSLAVYDQVNGAYFGADAFGAIVPSLVTDAADLPESEYLAGVTLFTRANAPWTQLADPMRFGRAIDEIERLAPHRILSAHGAIVHGHTARLLGAVRQVPVMEPWLPDDDHPGLEAIMEGDL